MSSFEVLDGPLVVGQFLGDDGVVQVAEIVLDELGKDVCF